jgi:hypothetical protein
VSYRGTQEQWKTVFAGECWLDGSAVASLNCSDGVITIE